MAGAAPVLTPSADMAPCPRVEVVFSALAAGTATVTVLQISDDGTVEVRDSIRAYAVGGMRIVDYEPPLGVNVTYQAEQFNAAGSSLGLTATATTIIPWSSERAVFQDPLDPGSAVDVEARSDMGESLEWRRDIETYRVGGKTVVLMGEAGLLESVPLSCNTDTTEQSDRLRELLRRTVVLVRTPPPNRMPRCLHVAIARPTEIPLDVQYGGQLVQWDVSGTEVTRTNLELAILVDDWQRYIDSFATWQEAMNVYATWFDAIQNPPAAI